MRAQLCETKTYVAKNQDGEAVLARGETLLVCLKERGVRTHSCNIDNNDSCFDGVAERFSKR